MSITPQHCALLLVLILGIFSIRKRKLMVRAEHVFKTALVIMIVNLVLDISSHDAMKYHDVIPFGYTNILCHLYMASIVWIGYIAVTYAMVCISKTSVYTKTHFIFHLITAGGSLLVAICPLTYPDNFSRGELGGIAVYISYVFQIFLLASALYFMFQKQEEMHFRSKVAVCFFIGSWVVAASIQYLLPQFFIRGFMNALGLMVLFYEMENPEAHMDRNVGCFNAHALLEYMDQIFDEKRKFSVIVLGYNHYERSDVLSDAFYLDLQKTVDALNSLKNIVVFKYIDPELWVICENGQSVDTVWEYVKESTKALNYKPAAVAAEDPYVVEELEDLRNLIHYYGNSTRMSVYEITQIDADKARNLVGKEGIRTMIKEALAEDRVEVFLQPIYSFEKKRFSSAEALARIKERNGNIVPPGAFIDVAEECGLINQIGEAVFEKTCRYIRDLRLMDYGIDYIEVNLSVRQCEKSDLEQVYRTIMNRYDVPSKAINLEITETASVHTKKVLLENMEKLIDFGVHFSLDDFGNGQSNLNYVIDMPVSIVKLDMEMTRSYFENEKAKQVVSATLDLVHDMGMHLVAEGVETKDQLDEMENIGVDYIQGYVFSKPLPILDFMAFLRERNLA